MLISKDKLTKDEKLMTLIIAQALNSINGTVTIHDIKECIQLMFEQDNKKYPLVKFRYNEEANWIEVNNIRIEGPAKEISLDEINQIVNNLKDNIRKNNTNQTRGKNTITNF